MAKIRGTNIDDFLFGTNGADTIDGRGGFDTLKGGMGNDVLIGGDGDDRLYGGAGNDILRPGRNSDINSDQLYGSTGSDTMDFRGNGPQPGATYAYYEIYYTELRGGITARINGESGTVTKSARDGGGVDRLIGMNFNQNSVSMGLTGTQRADRFYLDPGENRFINLNPMGGNDVIAVKSGDVRLTYWSGDASGIDVRVKSSKAGLMVGEVDDQFGDLDRFSGVFSIEGSRFDDTFVGSSGNDYFITREGDDVVNGRGGFDFVRYDRRGAVRVDVDLAKGTALNVWDRGDTRRDGTYLDKLTSIEHVRGSDGNDRIRGSNSAEQLDGRSGNDRLAGRGRNDTLDGGFGNDTLNGGSGNDLLFGGEGADRFEFRRGDGRDSIADFQDGIDTIRVITGASRFSQLRIADAGDDATVSFADVRITLQGVDHQTLDASDFMFG